MGKLRPLGRGRTALVFCCALVGIATLPATAVAAGATTGQATGVTPTSATLTGTVTSVGGATWHFDYGTTTAYGRVTPTSTVTSGTHPVSATVTGLMPGTTYHFRLVVQDSYRPTGSTAGHDVTFTTPLTPTTIATTGQATSVSARSATLNGVVNAGNGGATWLFEYGTTTSYGHSTTPRATNGGGGVFLVSTTITGLRPHTTYHFRLVVREPPPDPPSSAGKDSPFTTARAPGKLTLRHHGLIVRHGRAAIPLKCGGARGAICQGKLTLTTTVKSGKRMRTIGCGSGKVSAKAPSKPTARVKLSHRCAALLGRAPKHQLGARLKFRPPHHAKGLSTRVRLIRR